MVNRKAAHSREPNGLHRRVVPHITVLSGMMVLLVIEGIQTARFPTSSSIFVVEVLIFSIAGSAIALVPLRKALATSRQVSDCATAATAIRADGLMWLRRLTATGFFVSFGLAVLFDAASRNTRSLGFYLAISAAYGLVLLQIVLRRQQSNLQSAVLICQMVLATGLFRLGYYFLNSTAIVSDTYLHWVTINQTTLSAHIPQNAGYAVYFPAFHVWHVAAIEIAGFSSANYAIAGNLAMLIAIPATYLFAKEWKEGVGLLAAFCISITPFFLLTTSIGPSPFGIPGMILALYSFRRFYQRPRLSWLMVLWVVAAFAFLSHPITALVLSALLITITIAQKWTFGEPHPRVPSNTALTYSIIYVTYLAFIALSTFALFVLSLLSSGYQPPLATLVSPSDVRAAFVLESGFSILGFAALYVAALLLYIEWMVGRGIERAVIAFFTGLNLLPLLEIARGSFALQSTRVLLYLSLPLAIFTAKVLHGVLVGKSHHATLKATVLCAMFVLIFASTTSYLTGDGNRVVSQNVPSTPWFLAPGTLDAGEFLRRTDSRLTTFLDYTTFSYIGPNQSGRIPFSKVTGPAGFLSSDVLTQTGYFVFNRGYVGYLTYSREGATILSAQLEQRESSTAAALIYDSGLVTIYENP